MEQKYFEVYLTDREERRCTPPTIRGVYSLGRESIGIKGWIDVEYFEYVRFSSKQVLALPDFGLDIKLYRLLDNLLPGGGGFMVAYEMFWGESAVHKDTVRCIQIGFPLVASPLGYLLLQAGCLSIKDWYWPEGGREGAPKLQGLKPIDQQHAHTKIEEIINELHYFLSQDEVVQPDLWIPTRQRARKILDYLKGLAKP